ncbi:LysR family transcriptional regulator [Tistrella bauzanensis]|uniref:LysR family transcriptional regulator n=1 Tax=Tistrella arctica TaxID=3133430 RepID=A0ABU9YK85_9PROT
MASASPPRQRLGVPLFHRDARRFVLTSFGRDCYAQCARAVHETNKLFEMAERAGAAPSGTLHVICPPLLGTLMIERLVAEFAVKAPRVRLHLEETAAIVDPRQVSADLVIYGAFSPLPDLDVVARRILVSPYTLAAHPDVMAAAGPVTDPGDLARLDCLGFGPVARKWRWTLQRGAETRVVDFEPRFSTTHLSALIEAVRQGIGVAPVPTGPCVEDFRSGRLVRLLPDWQPPSASIYAIFPDRRSLSTAAAHFLDMIITRVPEILAGHPVD